MLLLEYSMYAFIGIQYASLMCGLDDVFNGDTLPVLSQRRLSESTRCVIVCVISFWISRLPYYYI